MVEQIIVQCGLHVTSLRIGQITGGHGGAWTTTDWFPIAVKCSIALGALPEAAGVSNSIGSICRSYVLMVILDRVVAARGRRGLRHFGDGVWQRRAPACAQHRQPE